MADYKKKKVHRVKTSKSRFKNNDLDNFDIDMTPSKKRNVGSLPQKKNMKVVKGKKLERQRRFKVSFSIVCVLLCIAAVLNFLLPAGLFENTSNMLSVLGSGGYPIEIYGTQTLNSATKGSYYYLLTDSRISAYSNNGNEIYAITHGFENPIMKTGETRALVYDQGGTGLRIYNLSKEVFSLESELPIIAANVTRSGYFVVATKSQSYKAEITVYNKRGKKLYTWNSAKDIINNVLLSPNGKKLAVSSIDASGGQYNSKVMLFEYDSADAVHSIDISGETVISLESSGKYLWALTSSGAKGISWRKYTHTDISSDLRLDMFRKSSAGMLFVFNRSSDKSDNVIMVYSNSGKKLCEFDFDGIISDILYDHGHIYSISETNVGLYNKQGELLRRGECAYGSQRLAVTGHHTVVAITDSGIDNIELRLIEE